jgi:RNA polymerase sigma-70 factor, ECF subfamily
MGRPSHEITELLRAWDDGNQEALAKLIPLVHHELKRLARYYMARKRLVDLTAANWQDRAHFFAVCAKLMRQILTDHARSRHYRKRGGGAERVAFNETVAVSRNLPIDLAALDDALKGLETVDPRKGQVVELRFFGGLSVEETAEVLKVSAETVKRDWRLAKVWLLREMGGEVRNDA